ncbi:hypothetical protein [Lactobacillus rizhaonensis]|uniref:hypothetical protein n=1 Tax=Lactobacillus rizhaonensis TaxID=3082863 RepID=UPI0030C6DB40
MLINGNEVNNLFLNGVRFRCLKNCYVITNDTYCDHLTYNINNGGYFRLDEYVNKNGVYVGTTVGRTYVFSSEVYKGTASDICKIYGSRLGDSHNYLNSDKIFCTFPSMNVPKGEIFLFSDYKAQDSELENFL